MDTQKIAEIKLACLEIVKQNNFPTSSENLLRDAKLLYEWVLSGK